MIVPLTEAFAQEVAAHLRDRDRREVEALLAPGITLSDWAHGVTVGDGERWCALIGETPVAMGGIKIVPGLPHLGVTWAVGTDRKLEAGPAIMLRAMRMHKDWTMRGVRKFQCYCLESPEESSEWLDHLGYVQEGRIAHMGANGENFLLWGTHGR